MVVSRYGIRTEGTKQSQPIVIIFRPKQKTIWTLFPDKKLYEERTGLVVGRPPLPTDPESPCKKDAAVVCQLLGAVVVHGRATEHWLISRKTVEKLQPIVQLWIDRKLQVALRETFVDGMTIELSNVEEKAQKIKSFLVPEDYAKKPQAKKKQ
jgi:hypothetical protein